MSEFRKRILEPLAIPVTAVAFIGGLVWGMSRFLLVTDKDMAVALAFVVSFGILVVAAFLANGTFGNTQKVALALLGIGIAAGGSVTTATLGIREFEQHVKLPPDFVLVAQGTAFPQKQIPLKATEDLFNIELDNKDPGTDHNFALYKDDKHTQVIFQGKRFPGVKREYNQFPNPGPGLYFFQCDVHPIPNMQGTVAVGSPPGGPEPGPGGPGGPGAPRGPGPGAPGPAGPGSPNPAPSPTGAPAAGVILALWPARRRATLL